MTTSPDPSGLLREALIPLATRYSDHKFHPEDHDPDDDCWVNLYRAIVGLDRPEAALAATEPGLDKERYEMCGACFHPMHVAPCRLSVRLTTDEEGFCYCVASEATYAARETALVCDRLCIHVDGCDRPVASLFGREPKGADHDR